MATRYLSYTERSAIQDSVRGVEKQLDNPITARAIRSKQRMLDTYQREKKRLARGTPPPITNDTERSQLGERLTQLQEAMVNGNSEVEPMPTYYDMWETPAGAVGHNTRWENTWKNSTLTPDGKVVKSPDGYGAIFEWKDGRRRLLSEQEADDPDVANLELLRPQKRGDGYRFRSLHYAPGARLSHEAWDEATGHVPSEQEVGIREAEATAVPPSAEEIYATRDVMPHCQGTNRVTGDVCRRRVPRDQKFCFQHNKEE